MAIRKGDTVVVISGSHKGKRGTVLAVKGDRVIVEKVAMMKRHTKASQKSPQGGILDKEGTIHISNVALFDSSSNKATRHKTQLDGDKKVRVGSKTGTKFPTAGM